MEPKLDEIAKAVKLLTDCGIETMLRGENKPTLASVPSVVFLKMFSEYEKGLVESAFGGLYILKAVHDGVEYRTYAYDYEINKGA